MRSLMAVIAMVLAIVGSASSMAQVQPLDNAHEVVPPTSSGDGRSDLLHAPDVSVARDNAVPLSVPASPSVRAAESGERIRIIDSTHRELPGELSPWGMFLGADIVVKAVMVGLAAASFLVWTIWIAKWAQLWLGRRRLRRDIAAISGQTSIDAASAALPVRPSLALEMLSSARIERNGSGGVLQPTTLHRISSRLADLEFRVSRDVRGGMSFLATVGATGPFIGLFGTVWGIMNSFIGISKSQTTNLAVVAPGIAEALLATAIGLVAAIPAVILYNNLGKGLGAFRRLARETRGEVERIVSREMEGQARARKFPSLASSAAE